MDPAFLPIKTSKLIVRVKLDTDLRPPVEPETETETEFDRRALFFVVLVVLLIAAIGYYYFSTPSGVGEGTAAEVESLSVDEKVQVETIVEPVLPSLVPVVETPPVVDAILIPDTTAMEIAAPETVEVVKEKVQVEPVVSVVVKLPESTVAKIMPEIPSVPDFSINVSRAQFTYGIKNREPIDLVEGIVPVKTNGIEQIYFFTELRKLKGQTIRHQWFHEGKLISELRFNVRGNRWRVNSSKRLGRAALGYWEVKVVNEAGDTLSSDRFEYK